VTTGLSRKSKLQGVCYFASEERFRAGTEEWQDGVWPPAREVIRKLQSEICSLHSLLFSDPNFGFKHIHQSKTDNAKKIICMF
jgi:hypothetical protein